MPTQKLKTSFLIHDWGEEDYKTIFFSQLQIYILKEEVIFQFASGPSGKLERSFVRYSLLATIISLGN